MSEETQFTTALYVLMLVILLAAEELGLSTWPRGYKTFFMLSSDEHKILNAHMNENINKFVCLAQISQKGYLSCS